MFVNQRDGDIEVISALGYNKRPGMIYNIHNNSKLDYSIATLTVKLYENSQNYILDYDDLTTTDENEIGITTGKQQFKEVKKHLITFDLEYILNSLGGIWNDESSGETIYGDYDNYGGTEFIKIANTNYIETFDNSTEDVSQGGIKLLQEKTYNFNLDYDLITDGLVGTLAGTLIDYYNIQRYFDEGITGGDTYVSVKLDDIVFNKNTQMFTDNGISIITYDYDGITDLNVNYRVDFNQLNGPHGIAYSINGGAKVIIENTNNGIGSFIVNATGITITQYDNIEFFYYVGGIDNDYVQFDWINITINHSYNRPNDLRELLVQIVVINSTTKEVIQIIDENRYSDFNQYVEFLNGSYSVSAAEAGNVEVLFRLVNLVDVGMKHTINNSMLLITTSYSEDRRMYAIMYIGSGVALSFELTYLSTQLKTSIIYEVDALDLNKDISIGISGYTTDSLNGSVTLSGNKFEIKKH
jgi:hypothetical protein